jgi:hypothetical protein
MTRFAFQNVLPWVMVSILPASLMGAGPGAVLYVSGSTTVNGAAVPVSSLVFPGDTIQTKSSSQADINASSAAVTILENSSVRFESNHVSIDHGSVNIDTAKQTMAAKAGLVTVTPASLGWTAFQVSHVNGAVQIIARKGNVNFNEGKETETLLQGQSVTLDQSGSTGNSKKTNQTSEAGAPPAAHVSALDSPILIGVGTAAVGFGLGYTLSRSGPPPSPSGP